MFDLNRAGLLLYLNLNFFLCFLQPFLSLFSFISLSFSFISLETCHGGKTAVHGERKTNPFQKKS